VGVQPGRKIFNTLIKKGAANNIPRPMGTPFKGGFRSVEDFSFGCSPVIRPARKVALAVGGWRGGESAFCPADKD